MLKVGVQSACLGFSDDKCAENFKQLRAWGFDAVDYNIDNRAPAGPLLKAETLTSFFDQSIEELLEHYRPMKEAAESEGVHISQMHAPFPVWAKERDDFNDYMVMILEKICAICAYVGCPAVVVHPITRSTKEKEWDTNMAIYRRLMPFALKYNVKICLENLFGGFKGHIIEGACSDAHEACRYIDTLNAEAGRDVFGFCFDVGHANIMGRNMREYLNILGKRLTILHIHDNNGVEDLHALPFSQTHRWGADLWLDWDGFIEGLRDIGYDGTLSFETFRVPISFPAEVRNEVMTLIAAIGKYMKNRIEAPKEV